MLNYSIQLHSFSDLLRLRRIASKYSLDGYVKQNLFEEKLRSVARLSLGLPLENANIFLNKYAPEDVERIEDDLKTFQSA